MVQRHDGPGTLGFDDTEQIFKFGQMVWDTGTLTWVRMTQPGSSGGGGAATIADGADVAQGATTDAEAAAGNGSVVALLKRLRTLLGGTLAVSSASLPLPAGAATSALQTTGNTSLTSIDGKTPALGQALAAAAVPVVLTAIQIAAITPPAAIAGFALDATLTGGNAKTIMRGGAKGTTAAADVTSTASGANHNPADVILYDAAGAPIDPRGLTSVVPGTGATNLGKAEDAAHVSGDVGVLILGVRSDVPNLPTVASTNANSDYAAPAVDDHDVLWVRTRQLVTYSAAYRLGDATAGQVGLTFTFVANANKQLGTIYHAAAAVKTAKLRKVTMTLSAGAAGVFDFELRALSAATAPVTGNPAITPRQHDPADGAAEATCLALPTTAGSLVGVDTGTVSEAFSWNAAAAAAQGNASGLSGQDIVLYEYKDGSEMKPLTMRAGVAEGFAVNGRCTAAVALRYTLHFLFTEE